MAPPLEAPPSLPVGPSAEEWRAMMPEARERFLLTVVDALADVRKGRFMETVLALEAQADEAMAKIERARVRSDEATARTEAAMAALRTCVLAALDTRGIPCPDDARALVAGCRDPATLQRWLLRALTASTAAEALAEASPVKQ